MDHPFDMPEGGYALPEWINEDPQYIEGCSLAGKTLSNELPVIPINWYHFVVIMNSHVKNIIFNRHPFFHAAYAYWED